MTEDACIQQPVEDVEQLLDRTDARQAQLLGPEGLLNRVLDTELAEHLGYEKGDPAGRGSAATAVHRRPHALVPGHEFTGRVVAVGPDGPPALYDSRVVVTPSSLAVGCPLWREGRSDLCENRNALGISRAGGPARYTAVRATSCYVLPDSLSYDAPR